ncbi:hypothetical protein O181_103626 [Austropuccinia psidii MF-1]|uniref:Tet-like 2OG-Fe(II) oxygenase domain-containing protein n=1 Tax=Austropuccinia psidii MF-1 TaxID=1389203 RepID=A0A9Q3JKU0_9BASI|nr:hypothetical protein [Austropuccinia psidii MF-1]
MPCGLQQGSHECVPSIGNHSGFAKALASNGIQNYLISCLLQHKVIHQPLGNNGMCQKTNEARTTQRNKFFSSTQPTAQISMPVSPNMTPSEISRVVDVTQMKHIHFGHVAIFSSTRLLISLVKFRPLKTMSEVEVNQSQLLFHKRKFTEQITTNGALLEGFMFAIGWPKCSTKNKQFGIYGGLRRIENAKYEWQNQGANLSSVGCILGQSLQYVGDKSFQKMQTCWKSLGVPSFNQVSYEADISTTQGVFEFASTLTFTMNQFKNLPHFDKDALL